MTSDSPREPYAWLEARTVRNASDMVLGCLLLVAAATAIVGARNISFVTSPDYLGDGFFPTLIGVLLAAVGAALLARGALGRAPHMRWRLWQVLVVAGSVAAIALGRLASVLWSLMYAPTGGPAAYLLLAFGPADYAASALLVLSVAIALARLSRLRAAGMALLGLLLGVIGPSMATGEPRLTLGLDQLVDGLDPAIVALGIVCVAESMVCLYSPALLLATYTRRIAGWRDPAVQTIAATGLRIVAALAIAASCYLAFTWYESVGDIGLVLLLGAFGVACKLLGWNRLVLLVGLACSAFLEQYLRQALLISRGHFGVFFERPISATLVSAAGAILVALLALSLYRALRRNAAGPAPA
jgi:TctA family transporter